MPLEEANPLASSAPKTLSLLTAYSLLAKGDDSGRTIKNTPPFSLYLIQLSINEDE
jgi:hypothetical protein